MNAKPSRPRPAIQGGRLLNSPLAAALLATPAAALALPALCPECAGALQAGIAARGRSVGEAIVYCPHQQALCIAHCKDGAPERYAVFGPLAADEAANMVGGGG